MSPRKNQPREMRMIAEWLALNFSRDQFAMNVRLGQHHPDLHPELLSEAEQRLIGVYRRMADAVVFRPEKMILIEAAIRPQPGDISIIQVYKRLLPNTPELVEHKYKPIEMLILAAIDDPVIGQIAREQNIRYIIYRPEWIDEYLDELLPRDRRASLTVL